METYATYKDDRGKHISDLTNIVHDLAVGKYIAFIKNGMKYVLRIESITRSNNNTEISITASGIVWKGGFASIDGIDVGSERSAANYHLAGGEPHRLVDWSDTDWKTEGHDSSYFSIYSKLKPLTIQNLFHTGTSDFSDDVLEFCTLADNDFSKVVESFSSGMLNSENGFVNNMF